MVYRIAVLDDDAAALQKTEEMLRLYGREHPEYALEVSCYCGMTAFMEAVCRQDENGEWAFDVLFMDIYLPDGNGMESARVLREKGFRGVIIFQSTLAEHAIEAFSVGALQYFVKPVCREKLDRTIGRAIEKIWHSSIFF